MRMSSVVVSLLALAFGVAALEGTGHPGQREPQNLTSHPARDRCPAASPDGTRIAFLSDRGGNVDIYSMATDGTGVRPLTTSTEKEEHPEFSPDGRTIVFVRDFEQRTEVWMRPGTAGHRSFDCRTRPARHPRRSSRRTMRRSAAATRGDR